jgi:chaperonin GroEL
MKDRLPLLEPVARGGRPLVIIAEDVDDEGIVPGGGVALLRWIATSAGVEGSIVVRLDKVKEARRLRLQRPTYKGERAAASESAERSGATGAPRATPSGVRGQSPRIKYEDLVKVGVIDPAKVVRSALQHASSIASLLLTGPEPRSAKIASLTACLPTGR